MVEQVQPAFAAFKTFIDREYLPASYLQVGVWQNARGADAYGWLVRLYTTTGMTPDEVHALGLSEVARIQGEMERVKATTGFTGTLPAFFTYLRTDPRFFYKTGPELLQAYRALAKRVDPELGASVEDDASLALWRDTDPRKHCSERHDGLCRVRCGRRIQASVLLRESLQARDTPYVGNDGAHAARSGARALSAGRDLAGADGSARVQETRWLHRVTSKAGRSTRNHSATKWGSMTIPTPSSASSPTKCGEPCGSLSIRGCMRSGGRASRRFAYFMEHAAKTEFDVTNEVDRYISWPGQALAYKVGELRIKEMRRRASARRGARFDLREFNDLLLSAGPMPLDLLDRRVDEWTAHQ